LKGKRLNLLITRFDYSMDG